MLSTFIYTNAIHRVSGSTVANCGVWAQSEKQIRNYANMCSEEDGDLNLNTCISEARIRIDATSGKPAANVKELKYFCGAGGIKIPNPMWMAGCCVDPATHDVKGTFAVIGNSLQGKNRVNISPVTVKDLQTFLHIITGGREIKLFSGNLGCSFQVIV